MLEDMARRPTRRNPNQIDVRPLVAAFGRLDRQTQWVVAVVLAVAGVVAAVLYVRGQQQGRWGQPGPQPSPELRVPATGPAAAGDHLLLGNPSGATADPANRGNYLLAKPYFALSYNDANGTPNWVSWRLTAADFAGSTRRQGGDFDPDPDLPAGFMRVVHRDYTGSRFDRGHMCPHGDRDATSDTSAATFVMTNIIPQAANVNQKAWNNLENYTRDLVGKQGMRAYVVSGPAGRGGRGLGAFAETIGNGKVVVPAECWKVVVAIPEDGGPDDPADVGPDARVIAVVMPNDNGSVGEEWASFRVRPADVERRTGYRFFDRLRPDVGEALRNRVDAVHVPPPEPRQRGGGRP